uniref:Spermatosis associated 22 n=1 Tax=Anser brachyrhynchus TaxID=132585 RepID=A0A8B9C3V3_9AVES
MKRSLSDTSTRTTAGCLPVPLFNQKKRNRQPLTSNPLKNETGTSSMTCTFDFSPTLLLYTVITYLSIQNRYSDTELCLMLRCRAEEKTPSTKVWNRNEYTPLSNRTDLISDSGTIRKFENPSNALKTVQQQKKTDNCNSPQHIKTRATNQTHARTGQWPVKPNTVPRSLQDHGLAYKFNCNSQQSNMNEKQFDCVPEDKIQEVSSTELKRKEKRNSLRIISAVIESMKHWSQYAYKTALLFEVLGKYILKDRELPRLIRGRVHRCMGNYDTKRNIFKCVSVRPATIPEQNTFQEFVKIADVEMTAYVKTMNEI